MLLNNTASTDKLSTSLLLNLTEELPMLRSRVGLTMKSSQLPPRSRTRTVTPPPLLSAKTMVLERKPLLKD
jgi:hypothetical protein